jgi:hypothetical protein
MTAQRAFSKKCASIKDCLFNAGGYWFAVFRDMSPDVKNVGFGKRRENIGGHRLG